MSRHDLYGPVHKGLRLALCELGTRMARVDFADPEQSREMLAALRRQLALGASHLAHEEHHIHAALEARAPGSTVTLEADHDHHRRAFEALDAAIQAVEAARGEAARRLGRDLYLRFTQFVAADYAHMAEEEMVVLPLLHRLFSDAELIAIEGAIVGSLPPEEAMAFMKLMIPAMNAPERIGFLGFVRATAPAEVFVGLLDFAARPTLTPRDYQDVVEGLGLAA
jgi:hypothetical protein